jgi:hypothetical protein
VLNSEVTKDSWIYIFTLFFHFHSCLYTVLDNDEPWGMYTGHDTDT